MSSNALLQGWLLGGGSDGVDGDVIERFEAGGYPMICARSGPPASKLVPVEAARRRGWAWMFSPTGPLFWWARWVAGKDRLWGRLPFAEGHVRGVTATWDKAENVVMLRGVHPLFIAACREPQRAGSSIRLDTQR
jgi:hypothetical protein